MLALTVESIGKLVGRPVDEMYLVMAKNHVLGLEPDQIARILGVTSEEVEALMETQDFKDVRLLVGAEYAKTLGVKDMSWDTIEATALEKLQTRVELERDTDTLLRIAAIANKAQRRTPASQAGVLDPAQAGGRVVLQLTKRYTEILNGNGRVTQRSETQQVSITDATNPKFEDIDAFLGVSASTPHLPRKIGYTTHEPEVTLDELSQAFEGRSV